MLAAAASHFSRRVVGGCDGGDVLDGFDLDLDLADKLVAEWGGGKLRKAVKASRHEPAGVVAEPGATRSSTVSARYADADDAADDAAIERERVHVTSSADV